MGEITALDQLLGAIAALLTAFAVWWQNRRHQQEVARRDDEADAIRDDTDAALRELGWLSDDEGVGGPERRPDGAPLDFVPGASGGLSDPDGRGVQDQPVRHGGDSDLPESTGGRL